MLAFALCCAFVPQGGEQDPPQGLTVVVVDVGQGDGIDVRAPNGAIHAVDGGPNGQGTAAMLPVVDGLAPQSYGFTFLSHFHDDHQGGLDEVLTRPFQFAYDRGDVRRTNTSPDTNNYLAAAGARRRTIGLGQVYALGGGAQVRCIALNGAIAGGPVLDPTTSAQEENSRSIALRLDFGNFSMWLGGDLTGGASSTLDVESDAALACGNVDVYKLNHHGSNTSTNPNLVSRLDPELAVVSCGQGNSFGHPTTTVTNRLVQAAALRTLMSTTRGSGNTIGFSVLGNIRIDTDGRRYRVTAPNGDFLDFWCDEVVPTALAAGLVRISEIHRNPNRVPDTNGEYVEVVTVGPRPLALKGMRLQDGAGTVTLASNLMLVPGRPVLFQVDGEPARNGGQPLGVTLPYSSIALGDTSDIVTVASPTATVDQVSYTATMPGGDGVAAERRDLLGPTAASNFAAATVPFGVGDRGSPGRRNDADATLHAVQFDAAAVPGELVLRGTALAHEGQWSILAMAYGTSPGFPFLNVVVPLNFDPLIQLFLGFPGTVALMPPGGYRSLRLALPQPSPLQGVTAFGLHLMLDLNQNLVSGMSAPRAVVLP
jgi:beta-lactamase superfamily II metal-dependent hydrolase